MHNQSLTETVSKGHKDSIQINKIRNEMGNVTTETEEFKKSSDPITKPTLNTTGKSGENGQFPRQIPNTKN